MENVFFRESSHAVGVKKLKTIEQLMRKQVKRLLTELSDDMHSTDSIYLNKILVHHVNPSINTLNQIITKIDNYDNGNAIR